MGSRVNLATSAAAALAFSVLAACSSGSAPVAPAVPANAQQQLDYATGPQQAAPLSLKDVLGRYAPAGVPRSALRIVDPNTIKPQIDVGQYGTPSSPGQIVDYNAGTPRQKPLCVEPNLYAVNYIEVDSTGELWVPHVTASGVDEISSNAPNCGAAGTTLSDSHGQPADIAFAASGIRYVSDILNPEGKAGNIAVYPKGATKPSSVLINANVDYSIGVGVDSKGNVFQSYVNKAGTGGILEFAGGKMPGTKLTGIGNIVAAALFIDKKNDIVVPDAAAASLNTYAPPYTKLTSSFSLEAQSLQCSVNAGETDVVCADTANDTVDAYKYPSGTYQYSFDEDLLSTATTEAVTQDPRN